MQPKKIYLTQEGLEELKKELDVLINVKRPENIQAIKEARALGDLSENADYDAAKNDQAEIDGRSKRIEKMLENVEIIEKVDTDKVTIGSTVVIRYVDDEDDTDEYKIVGSIESDPDKNLVSNESPIGKGLMGKKKGEIVVVATPGG